MINKDSRILDLTTASASPTEKPLRYKRNRSTRACEVCHKRKARCDSMIHIPCTNCVTFGSECTFSEPKVRRTRKRKDISTTSNDKDFVDQTGSDVVTDSTTTVRSPSLTSATFTTTTTPTTKFESESTSPSLATTTSPTSASSSYKFLKKKTPLQAISENKFVMNTMMEKSTKRDALRFFGPLSQTSKETPSYSVSNRSSTSSGCISSPNGEAASSTSPNKSTVSTGNIQRKHQLYATTASAIQMELLRNRGAFLIPEKSLCDELISDYFTKVYPYEPFVNKEKFLREYADGTVSLLLLQSVLLTGACVSSNPVLIDKTTGTKYKACSAIYHRAKAVYDSELETDPLIALQAIVMFLGFWDGFEDALTNSFVWTRTGISIAQVSGFHREIDPAETKMSHDDLKLAKRLFWYLYLRDVSTAAGYDRPVMIRLEDCDVKLPKVIDSPDDVPLVNTLCFIEMLKLTEVAYTVTQKNLNSTSHGSSTRLNCLSLSLNYCDMLLNSWRANLPSELKYSPGSNDKDIPFSVLVLNMYFYYIVCQIHGAAISKPPLTMNSQKYPSEEIFFKAIQIITEIESLLIQTGNILLCSIYHTTVFFFTSARTLVYQNNAKTPQSREEYSKSFDISMNALELLGQRFRIAAVVREDLLAASIDSTAMEKMSMTVLGGAPAAAVACASGSRSGEYMSSLIDSMAKHSLNSDYKTKTMESTHKKINKTDHSYKMKQYPFASLPGNEMKLPFLRLFSFDCSDEDNSEFDPYDLFSVDEPVMIPCESSSQVEPTVTAASNKPLSHQNNSSIMNPGTVKFDILKSPADVYIAPPPPTSTPILKNQKARDIIAANIDSSALRNSAPASKNFDLNVLLWENQKLQAKEKELWTYMHNKDTNHGIGSELSYRGGDLQVSGLENQVEMVQSNYQQQFMNMDHRGTSFNQNIIINPPMIHNNSYGTFQQNQQFQYYTPPQYNNYNEITNNFNEINCINLGYPVLQQQYNSNQGQYQSTSGYESSQTTSYMNHQGHH